MSELITVKEAMEFLKVSRATIYNLINKKGLPFKKVGRQTRFDVNELKDWMEETGNYPTIEKHLIKIENTKTGEEKIHSFSSWEDTAKFVLEYTKSIQPHENIYMAETYTGKLGGK